MSANYKKLGDYITQRREKNTAINLPICGVCREGLIPPKQQDADISLYNVFYKNDFIFNPARMELNSITLNTEYDKAICSSLYEIFYINDTSKLLPEFLFVQLKTDNFVRFCEFQGQGSVREYCRFANISEYPVIVPDLKEQEKIVNTYNAITKRIQLKQKINENLEKTAQCLFENVFKHELQKEEISFTDVIDLLGGGTPSTAEKAYWSGNIPFFAPADIDKYVYCFKTEKTLTEEGLDNCSSKLYPKNTTFVTCRGTVGKLALAGTPMAMNQSCYALKDKNGQYPFFTYSFAKFTVSKLKNKASGAVFSALVTKDFEMEKVFNPNLEKMKEYETKSSSIFKNISSNEKEIFILQELKQLVISRISGM